MSMRKKERSGRRLSLKSASVVEACTNVNKLYTSTWVMVYLGVRSIPKEHIMKRWTIDARDNLPLHLKHYEKDKVSSLSSSRRHYMLWITALDIVNLGDRNTVAYEQAMHVLLDLKSKLVEVTKVKDGRGLAEGEVFPVGSGQTCGTGTEVHASPTGSIGESCDVGEFEVQSEQQNLIPTMVAPKQKKSAGRPSTSRDRSPYEKRDKRPKHCKICQKPGHTRRTCSERGDEPQKPRKPPTCSKCNLPGHRRNTCIVQMNNEAL